MANFTLHIFESEFKEIMDFVSSYPNIETGGDLFGLWKANGDPVVQLIIGPGNNCRRTSVSFHQDTDYLARVGTYVNTSFMLCHIGSWHSHHQLSLTQPSAGDRSTVCNNFPEGLKRYIMIIANITRGVSSRQSVVIHPYMFTNGGHVCKPGKVNIISLGSPFREVGYVVTHITNGAEQHVSTKEAYSSRAPLEYHNRPSTRSKPISGAPRNFQTIPTNSESHLPMKVDKNFNQPSTWSRAMHRHDQSTRSNPMHSTDSTAERHSPMDVDPPDYHRVTQQQSTKSQHQVTENHDTRQPTQWYDTEEGGTILKEINREITTTMTSDINYSRDQYSKNLTMEFTHDGQKWTINFPKSFGNEPALISNSSYGKDVPSKNVVKDIRKACRCDQCQNKIIDRQHSPSKEDHPLSPPKRSHSPSHVKRSPPHSHSKNVQSPSPPKRDPSPPSKHVRQASHSRQGRSTPYDKRPQSRRVSKSPPQPWYNTEIGKPSVQQIKSDIETYLKATSNVGRVRAMETATSKGRTKQLIFYHNGHDWIIEFVSSSKDVELKIDRYGQKKCVATLKPPYDVVRELKHHCSCTNCRSTRQSTSAGQRRQGSALTRPNSRYDIHVHHRPPSRVSSTPKFFATEKGEEKFKNICTEINTLLLNGRNVDMSRPINSKDVKITFEHNRRQWEIMFPFRFPDVLPKLDYADIYMYQTVHPVSVSNDDVLRAIRKNCDCWSCRPYRY